MILSLPSLSTYSGDIDRLVWLVTWTAVPAVFAMVPA